MPESVPATLAAVRDLIEDRGADVTDWAARLSSPP